MKELTRFQLDYIYCVLSGKLEEHILSGFHGLEDDIAELHRCLATVTEMLAQKAEEEKAAK